MHAQGYDVEMKQLAEHWRANFYPAGIAHSIVKGTAWEREPWRAVQRAAWPHSPRRDHGSVVASSF